MKRTFLDYFIISLKGIAMGAADVVPGVSGGTIAFISGIYEELIETINKVNFKTLTILKREGFKAAWQSVNGNFLLSLLIGIGISILTLSKLVKWLLENKPILIWSFFFGLVLASIIYIAKQIEKWDIAAIMMLILGAVSAFYITTLPPMVNETSSSLFMFLAGALAICAMILPGISGGFILLLLGAYKPALDALHDKDVKTISTSGIKGHDGCHYTNAGYVEMGDWLAPIIAKDFYESNHTGIASPDIVEAYYSKKAKEITLVFSENIVWPSKKIGKYAMKDYFYLDGNNHVVEKGEAKGNKIVLTLNSKMQANTISYLPGHFYENTKDCYQGPWIFGENGLGALSFDDFTIKN